jgi:hypothetical protein
VTSIRELLDSDFGRYSMTVVVLFSPKNVQGYLLKQVHNRFFQIHYHTRILLVLRNLDKLQIINNRSIINNDGKYSANPSKENKKRRCIRLSSFLIKPLH